jgi:hypothetical protein
MNVRDLKGFLNGLDESYDEFEIYTEGCDCFGTRCGAEVDMRDKTVMITRDADPNDMFRERVRYPEPPTRPFRPASRLGPMAP